MKEEIKKWMEKAEKDLKHAKSSLVNKDFDWSQLASQQSAEKALKATCMHKEVGLIKVHDLTILARKVDAPDEIIKKCGLLNPFYTAARYPDAEEETDEKSEETAAKDAVKAAKKVVKWCKKQIKT